MGVATTELFGYEYYLPFRTVKSLDICIQLVFTRFFVRTIAFKFDVLAGRGCALKEMIPGQAKRN